mmetsp:Transcript_20398/g.37120  ORF Transcript_20398/g.37120 Transcript_20398/m.37120 type:complete len:301 (+) Transcript_20398:53-955(+)
MAGRRVQLLAQWHSKTAAESAMVSAQRRAGRRLALAGLCVTAPILQCTSPAWSQAGLAWSMVGRSSLPSVRQAGPFALESRSHQTRCYASGEGALQIDQEYPGTAVERLTNIHGRVIGLTSTELSVDWQDVRRKLLWAGGLRDLEDAIPGQGYTGHAFNDDNHCDLTAMLGDVAHNQHGGGIEGIALGNLLGPGIEKASLPELGPGGSWSTCTNGCNMEPPRDVAHVQFRARVAFKLVWCPPDYTTFVLVDDAGELLNYGTPTGTLPDVRARQRNYMLTKGGRYARVAEGFKAGAFDAPS